MVFLQATVTYIALLGWLDFSHTLLSHLTATVSVTLYLLHYLSHPLNTFISTHLICLNAQQGQGQSGADRTLFHKPAQFFNSKYIAFSYTQNLLSLSLLGYFLQTPGQIQETMSSTL